MFLSSVYNDRVDDFLQDGGPSRGSKGILFIEVSRIRVVVAFLWKISILRVNSFFHLFDFLRLKIHSPLFTRTIPRRYRYENDSRSDEKIFNPLRETSSEKSIEGQTWLEK